MPTVWDALGYTPSTPNFKRKHKDFIGLSLILFSVFIRFSFYSIYACLCKHTPCVCRCTGEHKRMLDLGSYIQVTVRYLLGARNQARFSRREVGTLKY